MLCWPGELKNRKISLLTSEACYLPAPTLLPTNYVMFIGQVGLQPITGLSGVHPLKNAETSPEHYSYYFIILFLLGHDPPSGTSLHQLVTILEPQPGNLTGKVYIPLCWAKLVE